MEVLPVRQGERLALGPRLQDEPQAWGRQDWGQQSQKLHVGGRRMCWKAGKGCSEHGKSSPEFLETPSGSRVSGWIVA